MNKKLFLGLLLLFSTCISFAQVAEPVKWKTSYEKISDKEYKLVMEAIVEPSYYIYDMANYKDGPTGTSFKFTTEGDIELIGGVEASETPVVKYDESFKMDIGKFKGNVKFYQSFKINSDAPAKITVLAEWMSCTEETCTPPTDEEFTFYFNQSEPAAATIAAVDQNPVGEIRAGNENARSIWSVIIEAILWGFAALLTPCVFPMVPMTVSFFMKGNKNKAKGRAMASFYGLSIVSLYTLPIAVIILITYFVGGDAVTADIFNWLSTHWVPNVIFFLVFMIFAASFLGAFEIVMPSWLVNKSDEKADKGGFIGVFFMALTLVLVSFSCTGPIVGSILVQSTQGEIWQPIIAMLVFSTAFALPFTLFAFFPSLLKNLPKSGGWLNSVKVVLGFIELALGLKFLSVADQTYHWGILDREVYLALWIAIFSLLGMYFLGKLKFSHDSETPYVKVKNLFFAIITFAFVVYLIPGMWGAPLKALSGYLPPVHTMDFNLTKGVAVSSGSVDTSMPKAKYSDFLHLPQGLNNGFFDYEEGVAYAQKVNKPVFLDFTGHGCVNCREMEANVISDPRVLEILNNEYVLISLYVDDKLELPENEWKVSAQGKTLKTLGKINAAFQVERFGINAQPYYVLMDTKGEMLNTPFAYEKDVEKYIQFLKDGVAKFNQSQAQAQPAQ